MRIKPVNAERSWPYSWSTSIPYIDTFSHARSSAHPPAGMGKISVSNSKR